MKGPRRIGVLGGTFDPIHIGHLALGEDAAWELHLDRVLFVPNRISPLKQDRDVAATEHRVAMVKSAIAGNPLFQVSTIELEREGPSYTLDTMRALRDRLPAEVELAFITGREALADLHRWHQPEALMKEFEVVFADRSTAVATDWSSVEAHFPNLRERVRVIHVPQLEISSSAIRERVRAGAPIRYLVGPEVERYIRLHRLYGSGAEGV